MTIQEASPWWMWLLGMVGWAVSRQVQNNTGGQDGLTLVTSQTIPYPASQESTGRGRQISVSSRPAWCTEWVPGQPGLFHREPCKQKQKTKKVALVMVLFYRNKWLRPCTYAYLYAIHMLLCVHVDIQYAHIYVHVCMCVHMYIYICVRVCVYVYICVCTCMCTPFYLNVHV